MSLTAKTVACLFVVAVLTVGAAMSQEAWTATTPQEPTPAISLHFSPRGGCTDAIIAELATAKESVLVQAYSFTSAPIARALTDAQKRGCDVRVILDDGQKRGPLSISGVLSASGVKVLFDGKHAIAHNKVIVIDGKVVVTGSFNFTKAAEQSNAENLLIVRVKQIAARYAENWAEHAEHSTKK